MNNNKLLPAPRRQGGECTRTLAAACVALALLGGCATTSNPDDPLEGYNRAMFRFNEELDRYVAKPAAEAYKAVLPAVVRTGIGNFTSNLEDPWIGVNNLLQGKVAEGIGDLMRFVFNSTLGLFGLIDIATPMGLEKHDEDLGQTLGRWGVGEGAYIVLPFFGPRTVRDAAALPVDFYGEKPVQTDHVRTRNAYTAVYYLHARSTLLGAEKTVDEGTIDKYAYVRDFYLQQRRYKIADGNIEYDYEDFDDEDFDDDGHAALAPSPGRGFDRVAAAALERLELNAVGARAATANTERN